MPDGRVHKCGTVVEEEEVQIDVRAEYTISLRNSLRLDELFKQTKIPGFLKPLAKKGIGMLENLQAAEEGLSQPYTSPKLGEGHLSFSLAS